MIMWNEVVRFDRWLRYYYPRYILPPMLIVAGILLLL